MSFRVFLTLILVGSFIGPLSLIYSLSAVRKIRNIRRPVKERMLRSPGESLQKTVSDLSDNLSFGLVVALIAPLFVGFMNVTSIKWATPLPPTQAWVGLAMAGAFSGGISIYLLKITKRFGDYRLALSGERAVAEQLQELVRSGCYVFHDLQPESTWNIDHIVVAPESVLVIETKTRRKRGDNTDAHEVIFDGKQLHLPRWSDVKSLEQATRNAAWVRRYLSSALSEPVKVEPVVTLPGWMVKRKGRGQVYVVNPKEIRALVRARGSRAATPAQTKQMRQIAFALDQKCRSSEF